MISGPPRPSIATVVAGASANLRGMAMMFVATTILSCMHGLIRHVSAEMHPFEIAFFRNVFGLLVLVPFVVRAGRAGLVSQQPGLQLLRGVVVVVAMLSWFYALSVVPIAQATALSFTAAIFGSLAAVVFLGERMRRRRWTAVAISVLGVLVVLRPGLAGFDAGSLIVLLASLSWAGSVVLVKLLSRTDSSVAIVTWITVIMAVLTLPPALLVWAWPTPAQLAWLGLIGALGTAGHLAMTRSFKLADVTAVLPIDFTRLIWTSLIGYLAFAEVPDIWVWIGGGVIFASTTYIAYREHRAHPEARGGGEARMLG